MKKTLFRIFALALFSAALCALPAFAAESDAAVKPDYVPPVRVWGQLTKLEDGGLLVENSNESDPYNEIILHGESIHILDAVTGLPLDRELRDGETVYAWVGPAMTMSLPPQATAQLILANIPADYAVPQYYQIARVEPQATAAIYPPPALTHVDLVTTGGEKLTVTDQAALVPFLTKQLISLGDLTPGARILVWSGRDGAVSKVTVFPYEYQGWLSWTASGKVSVCDQSLSVTGKIAGGDVLLPIRAVAEAAGYKVTWAAGKGAVVSRPGGGAVFSALPGQTAVQTADGETALTAPILYEAGVTYLPAGQLAYLLDLFRTY